MKETESEAKMRFFTNVSHEIRTPLTLIHSPLKQLLDRGDLDWEIKRSLLLIYRNVKRLMVQVNWVVGSAGWTRVSSLSEVCFV